MNNWNWTIQQNYIFGYNENVLNKSSHDVNSVIMFDLDYTLIKTKSGKTFPISKTDWEFLYSNIPDKLNNLKNIKKYNNAIIGIVSNQKGLKTQTKISEWIEKCVNICKSISSINFIFASIDNDRFRKPMCGSFELLKNTFVNIDWNNLLINDKILYVGDAFGRNTDFSDTDIKFAINCGFKFKTPEIFFGIKNSNKVGHVNYPIINYFHNDEQEHLFNELSNLIKIHNKILIILIGLPASGKSFIRKELIKRFPQFSYFNNDDIQCKIQSKTLIKKMSSDYDFIIDDNTNLIKEVRETKLKQFQSYYKIGIWFDYDLEICWHLNWMRMYWFGEKLLPKVTYNTLNKKFLANNKDIDKNFNKFFRITKVFNEFNFDNKIKYYF